MEKQPVNTVKKDKLQVIDWLIEHFPNAFFKKGTQIKPLKIGIFDDIIDFYERLDSPPFSKKSLREALSYYSASPAYLNCQKENVARIDIYGNEVDIVTQEQARYAHQRYVERYNTKKEKSSLGEVK
ncbi:activator of osmoprotectant transporter ProP (N-terminal part) [Legionella wadsworthii]|uniref:Activator of osmoprotectant transporter ProP (N-terminal part) n=1 Tax=Legionella wadsworthii TaxID=28088 RepID=A0A378LRJ8_9GAMM|nr:ProQ/FinO family protein [Legionella wadsworthii]STY29347.1 activator of osmoprotectant transporter ProP (N-terminal part) [Legionella wadsworthii]